MKTKKIDAFEILFNLGITLIACMYLLYNIHFCIPILSKFEALSNFEVFQLFMLVVTLILFIVQCVHLGCIAFFNSIVD